MIGTTIAVIEGFPMETGLKRENGGYMGGQLTVTDLSTPAPSGFDISGHMIPGRLF